MGFSSQLEESKKPLFRESAWQPVAKLTPLITSGIPQYSAHRQAPPAKWYIWWHQQVQKPYVTSKSRRFTDGRVPESQITSPWGRKTKKPQTSIVPQQSSRPRTNCSCGSPRKCSGAQHWTEFPTRLWPEVSKQASSPAVFKWLDWCISLFFLRHANYREGKATGRSYVLQELFLQSNKEYYNLFSRGLLDHSHSYGFRNSLVSLT